MSDTMPYDEFIERKIVTGLVVSTDYIQWLWLHINLDLIESPELRRIAAWCLEYFDEYSKAPDRNIETIYMDHLKHGRLPKSEVEDIATTLRRISDDFECGDKFNVDYLKDQTKRYFRDRELRVLVEQMDVLIQQGRGNEAEKLKQKHKPYDWGDGVESGLKFVSLEHFESRVPTWLFKDTVARAMFNLWCGEPDVGKSTMMAYMTAVITTGGTWPDGTTAEIGEVLIITEDATQEILKPRLEAAGADVTKVHLVGTEAAEEGFEPLESVVGENLVKIDRLLSRYPNIVLVFIDPIFEYVEDVKVNSSADIRQRVTRPLTQLARRREIAMVGITHPNKTVGQSARMRVSGGDAWVTASQLAWLFAEHPRREDCFAMAPIRNKLSPERRSWTYTLVDKAGFPTAEMDSKRVRISVEELVMQTPTSKVEACVNWLRNYLTPGPKLANDIYEAASSMGYKRATLLNAKKQLNIQSFKEEGVADGQWSWALRASSLKQKVSANRQRKRQTH